MFYYQNRILFEEYNTFLIPCFFREIGKDKVIWAEGARQSMIFSGPTLSIASYHKYKDDKLEKLIFSNDIITRQIGIELFNNKYLNE